MASPGVQPSLLIVVDDEAYSYALSRYFRDQGYRVEVESEAAKGAGRSGEPFDVVLVDMSLGSDAAAGLSLIDAWKRAGDSELIMLTGSAGTQNVIDVLRRGAFDYVLKPVAMDVLCVRVDAAVEKRREAQTANHLLAQLRAQELERLHLLKDGLTQVEHASGIGVWVATKDVKGRVRVEWSPQMYRLFGLTSSRERPTLERMFGLVHGDDVAELRRQVEAALTSGAQVSCDFRVKAADGTLHWMHAKAEAANEKVVGSLQDITVQRRATDDFDSFFALNQDLFCIASPTGEFERVNPAFCRVLGYDADELQSAPFVSFVHPEDLEATIAETKRINSGLKSSGFENRYRARDGSYRVLNWRSVTEVTTGRIFAVARDVTSQREIEKRLAISERMATVGSLAAGVAHEINNPLSYVLSNLRHVGSAMSALRATGSQPDALDDLSTALSDAIEGAERIRVIVRDLKSFARPSESLDGNADVHVVMDGSISMAMNEIRHRAQLIRNYGECPPVAAVDSRLGQVFLNLLVNAAQAMPEGAAGQNQIFVRTSTDADGLVRVDIEDTGCGIPPDALTKIFDPFYTTKPVGVGTGLGLYICHNLIQAMKGELTVRSVLDKGTCFTVRLRPSSEAEAEAEAMQTVKFAADKLPAGVRNSRRAKVMFIDDEVMLGRAAQRLLSREHDVEVISDAQVALNRLTAGESADVIFCDLMMPNVSGAEFYEQLSRARPDLVSRVVFITGGAFTPEAMKFLAEVPNPRLEKPFDLDALRSAAENLLH